MKKSKPQVTGDRLSDESAGEIESDDSTKKTPHQTSFIAAATI